MSLARTSIVLRLLGGGRACGADGRLLPADVCRARRRQPGAPRQLSAIDLPPIDKPNASREARVGIQIRNALAFKLYGNATGAPPLYKLVLRFGSSRSSLILDP